jgi:hypothetical protein
MAGKHSNGDKGKYITAAVLVLLVVALYVYTILSKWS